MAHTCQRPDNRVEQTRAETAIISSIRHPGKNLKLKCCVEF